MGSSKLRLSCSLLDLPASSPFAVGQSGSLWGYRSGSALIWGLVWSPKGHKGTDPFLLINTTSLMRNHSAFPPSPTAPAPAWRPVERKYLGVGPDFPGCPIITLCTYQNQVTMTLPPPSQRKQRLSDKGGFRLSIPFPL